MFAGQQVGRQSTIAALALRSAREGTGFYKKRSETTTSERQCLARSAKRSAAPL